MQPVDAGQIDAMRRFTRFYTRQAGLLQPTLLESPFAPTQARILYEIATAREPTASRLAQELRLDSGYISRILSGFVKAGLLERRADNADRRTRLLLLTPAGRAAFAEIDQRSRQENAALLGRLGEGERTRLVNAMQDIERLIDPEQACAPLVLRPHRPGDMGWVVSRHGALYAQEYGWNSEFEALVCEITAAFLREFRPSSEVCWIAERAGCNVGSAYVVRQSDEVAKLRLVLVEPSERGRGTGRQLVDQCIRFARDHGYAKMTLWTNDILHAARHIYQKAGFRLVEEERHRSFGHDLVGQYWELQF